MIRTVLAIIMVAHLNVMCELCAECWATVIMPSGLYLCEPCAKRYSRELSNAL